jgi:hypothetical protein
MEMDFCFCRTTEVGLIEQSEVFPLPGTVKAHKATRKCCFFFWRSSQACLSEDRQRKKHSPEGDVLFCFQDTRNGIRPYSHIKSTDFRESGNTLVLGQVKGQKAERNIL